MYKTHISNRRCCINDCEEKYYSNGFCKAHERRRVWSETRKVNMNESPIQKKSELITRKCEVKGCERKHYAKGMCVNHYNFIRRTEVAKDHQSVCKFCSFVVAAKGLCHAHYQADYMVRRDKIISSIVLNDLSNRAINDLVEDV